MADNIAEVLQDLSGVSGFIGASLVDANSGMTMGTIGGSDSFNVDVASAANTEVVKAKMEAIDALGLDAGIEDILITLSSQYHLIRPLEQDPFVFFYLALDRNKSNLALARRSIAQAAEKLKF